MSKKGTPEWALDNVRFDSDAGEDLTCREYMAALLDTLWVEEEGFCGKRPFGNSGWQGDMFEALTAAGCLNGAKYQRNELGFVREMIIAMERPAS